MKRAGLTYRRPDKLTRYAEAVRHAGAEPVGLLAPGPPSLAGLDGLVITGGTDLAPALYGEPPHPLAEPPDRERDTMERRLLEEALARDLPVLAICRGHQLLHVLHGGGLIQHLDVTDRHSQKSAWDAHSIMVEPGTLLAAIAGPEMFFVNSRHHQAARGRVPGLAVSAYCPDDGVIEALERPDLRFALAVQWHPEERVPGHDRDTRLFEAFVNLL